MGDKTNPLSIYLIKQEIDEHDIVDAAQDPIAITEIGTFYFEQSHPHPPDWLARFFGSTIDSSIQLYVSSAQGALVVPIEHNGETRFLAVSFGHGRHLLKEGVAEERFSLKVVLNSVDPESFRSIDKTSLGSVPKHSREQMSRDVPPADFGLDVEQDLINSVTGTSRDKLLGNKITGRAALTLSVKVDIHDIKGLLSHCIARFESTDYKKDFDWIDQIADVRDPSIEKALFTLLTQRLVKGNLDKVWMAVPEIIDWADLKGFRYRQAHRAPLHDDLKIGDFLRELGEKPITIDVLRESRVYMISAARDEEAEHWSALRCTYAELSHDGRLYVLTAGKWYEIAKDFSDQVQDDFKSTPTSTLALPDCTVKDEAAYNESAAATIPETCCMDRKLIVHGGGHNKVEFCDLYKT